LLALGGCASKPRKPPTAAAAPATRRTIIVGEVIVVDEERRFVLVDLKSNLYVPGPGTALRTTNAARETAHLKASPEQKRPFVAADIVDGDPAVGDQVVQ
jgi:glutathione synthase/RimK-type ligase-like ATP-grasp enzyme